MFQQFVFTYKFCSVLQVAKTNQRKKKMVEFISTVAQCEIRQISKGRQNEEIRKWYERGRIKSKLQPAGNRSVYNKYIIVRSVYQWHIRLAKITDRSFEHKSLLKLSLSNMLKVAVGATPLIIIFWQWIYYLYFSTL